MRWWWSRRGSSAGRCINRDAHEVRDGDVVRPCRHIEFRGGTDIHDNVLKTKDAARAGTACCDSVVITRKTIGDDKGTVVVFRKSCAWRRKRNGGPVIKSMFFF